MILAAQCRAARALIDWPASKLSRESKVKLYDIRQFERGSLNLLPRENEAVRVTLEGAGVEFLNDGQPGVRLRRERSE